MIRWMCFHATKVVLVLSLAVGAGGCGDELPEGTVREATTLNEVPEKAMLAAKNALPGVTFQDVWKNVDGRSRALHSYEIRGRAENGKVREVRVSTAGAILELE